MNLWRTLKLCLLCLNLGSVAGQQVSCIGQCTNVLLCGLGAGKRVSGHCPGIWSVCCASDRALSGRSYSELEYWSPPRSNPRNILRNQNPGPHIRETRHTNLQEFRIPVTNVRRQQRRRHFSLRRFLPFNPSFFSFKRNTTKRRPSSSLYFPVNQQTKEEKVKPLTVINEDIRFEKSVGLVQDASQTSGQPGSPSSYRKGKQLDSSPADIQQPILEIDFNAYDNLIQTQPECGVSQTAQSRILGGLDAGYGQFPWAAIVNILGENIDKMCAGTLVTNKFVATAGHCTSYCRQLIMPECTDPVPMEELVFKITLGEYDYENREYFQDVRTYHAVNIYLHPLYKNNLRLRESGFLESDPHYDIALLELDTPVKPSQYISPICLPDIGEPLTPDLATVIGWGRVGREPGAPHSSVLQAVTVPVLTREQCANMDGSSVPTSDQLCAGISYADHSACPGDSGGGLMTRDLSSRWFLIGIVSTGPAECGLTPVIYHNVSHSLPWIYATIHKRNVV